MEDLVRAREAVRIPDRDRIIIRRGLWRLSVLRSREVARWKTVTT